MPRIESTRALLDRCGATAGPVFGPLRDRDLYAMIMEGEVETVALLTQQLAEMLVDLRVARVAGDAADGYNPAHDLSRAMLDLAVEQAQETGGRTIENLEFAAGGPLDRGAQIVLDLDEAALARKRLAVQAYAGMQGEVETTLRHRGEDVFRIESLRAANRHAAAGTPDYERYGAERVAIGSYSTPLRRSEHFAPFEARLREAQLAAARR